jgi:putative glycosyltransferase (TIGR04372 family)
VREKPNNPSGHRLAKLENYFESILEVTKRDGWVIRFGTGEMKPLSISRNVIDLNTDCHEFRILHLYLLARCRFLITTNSGPATVAWALGTPVLQTNTIAVGRNLLSASPGSLFLPKKYFTDKGCPYSFSQLLESREAYSETDLREKYKQGVIVEENSAGEILMATRDIFRFLEHDKYELSSNKLLNEIRREYGAVGYGLIAPSFLSTNEDWFLK